MLETPKMRIHYIQRHLHGVEAEFVSGSDLQHPEMNERILMAGKTDVTDLPCLPGVHHGFDRAAGCKDRSEERRVGEEGRCWWGPCPYKKKKNNRDSDARLRHEAGMTGRTSTPRGIA